MTTARTGGEIVPSPILGMLIFIGTEVMFYAALISTFLVIRSGEAFWPPPLQPRLPVEATAFNTLVLLISGFLFWRAHRMEGGKDTGEMVFSRKILGWTVLLGLFFVIFQGYEWVRLVSFGLTLSSSIYGALFYLIIGAHAMHALGAVLFMVYLWWRMGPAHPTPISSVAVQSGRILWTFVVGIWPLLYGLVYLW